MRRGLAAQNRTTCRYRVSASLKKLNGAPFPLPHPSLQMRLQLAYIVAMCLIVACAAQCGLELDGLRVTSPPPERPVEMALSLSNVGQLPMSPDSCAIATIAKPHQADGSDVRIFRQCAGSQQQIFPGETLDTMLTVPSADNYQGMTICSALLGCCHTDGGACEPSTTSQVACGEDTCQCDDTLGDWIHDWSNWQGRAGIRCISIEALSKGSFSAAFCKPKRFANPLSHFFPFQDGRLTVLSATTYRVDASLVELMMIVQNTGATELTSCDVGQEQDLAKGDWAVTIPHLGSHFCIGKHPLKPLETRSIHRLVAKATHDVDQPQVFAVSVQYMESTHSCATDCNQPIGGRCNTLLGLCECNSQHSGDDCSCPAELRQMNPAPSSCRIASDRAKTLEDFVNNVNDDDNRPKEISVHCPVDPLITINHLDNRMHRQGSICFHLEFTSETFNTTLAMPCQ